MAISGVVARLSFAHGPSAVPANIVTGTGAGVAKQTDSGSAITEHLTGALELGDGAALYTGSWSVGPMSYVHWSGRLNKLHGTAAVTGHGQNGKSVSGYCFGGWYNTTPGVSYVATTCWVRINKSPIGKFPLVVQSGVSYAAGVIDAGVVPTVMSVVSDVGNTIEYIFCPVGPCG